MIDIQLLGPLALRRDGAVVALPQSKKTRALLAYLVLTGRPQRRAHLCDLLWDVADDPRGALRWCLSKLRPLVDEADARRIVTEGDTVAFVPAGATVDVELARAALARGPAALTVEDLTALAARFRGELLEGLDMSDFDDYQAWCVAQRETTRKQRADVLRALIARLRDQPLRALPHARALVGIEPVDEAVRTTLVELLLDAGRPEEAEQQRIAGDRQLRELGVEPAGLLERAWRQRPRTPLATAPTVRTTPAPAPEPAFADDAPMVGRRAECARLTAILDEVVARGSERAIVLAGEPGVGKTRLLISFLERVRAAGGTVFAGRAFEAERNRPYGPWIDILRRATAERPGPDGALAPLLPELAGPDTAHTRARMFAAVVEVIAQLTARGPVAIALDDVQWLDEASAELLHFVGRKSRGRPVLLALTARAGEIVDNDVVQAAVRSLRRERLLEELELGPLDATDIEALVAGVAPAADPGQVSAQCGGNPLFALELARAGAGGEHLPRTLAEVVRERVDRLPAASADLLRWTAALDPAATVARLSSLTTLSTEELMTALEQLERHALLRTREPGSYGFCHDVVRQVVYSELSEPRRRLMHGRIAELLASEGATDEARAAELARHASLAGNAAMAARACVAAGQRALQMYANRDALALARRGARYAETLPDPERTDLAIELWDVQLAAQTPRTVDAVCAELEELAERALDAGHLEHARRGFHMLAYLRWEGGRAPDAARHMLQAEQLTRGAGEAQRASALAEAARCLVLLDRDLPRAEALALEARAIATRLDVEPAEVADAVGMLRMHQGQLDEARARFEAALQLARRARDRHGEFHSREHLVCLELLRGDFEAARGEAGRLLALGERMREGSEGPYARGLAAVSALGCDEPGARERLEQSLAELRVVDAKQRLAFVLLAAAAIELDRDRPHSARVRAEEALPLATTLRRRSDTAWAHALAARAASVVGDRAAQRAHIDALRATDLTSIAAHQRAVATGVLGDVLDIDPGE